MKNLKNILLFIGIFTFTSNIAFAMPSVNELEFIPGVDIKLPEPQKTGGMPLMDALNNRKTERSFSPENLDEQTLSNILWAANGINRPDGKRTAPSAMNYQEIEIFAVLPQGFYYYAPKQHYLKRMMKEDLRPLVGNAPLTLIYVADLTKQNKTMAACDCGFIGQNVYLYASAFGLSTVFRANLNTHAVSQKMGLNLSQEVLYGQSIGYPLKPKKDKS